MVLTLWLVSRIRLPGTRTDMSDVLLQCLRSISAVVNPLDHGLLVLALASQNTWNAPSEIIPTWDLRNIWPKLKFPANCVVAIGHVCFLWDLQNPMRTRYASRGVIVQCMLVLHGNSTIAIDSQIFLRKTRESKMEDPGLRHPRLINRSVLEDMSEVYEAKDHLIKEWSFSIEQRDPEDFVKISLKFQALTFWYRKARYPNRNRNKKFMPH